MKEMKDWILLTCLGLITLVAFGLRFAFVDSAPRGLLADEANFGYIAYSLLQTGKDEHGVSWPLIFQAFGDYKLPLYGYSLLPFVAWLGLSPLAVRMPAVLAGTFLPLVMYGLLRALKMDRKIALMGALVSASAPWLLILGRFGYESMLGLSLWVAGLWCAIYALERKAKWAWLGVGICWGLTWYAYIAYRLLSVGMVVVLVWLAWKEDVPRRMIVWLITSFGIVIVPMLWTGGGTARFAQIGLLGDEGLTMTIAEQRYYCQSVVPDVLCRLVWNKVTVGSGMLLQRYAEAFGPTYLFTLGEMDLAYLQIDTYGWLGWWWLPFFYIGSWVLLKNVREQRVYQLLLVGLLLGPLPSALAGTMQKVRASGWMPFVVVVCLLGLTWCVKRARWVYPAMVQMIVVMTVLCWFQLIWIQVPKEAVAYGVNARELSDYVATLPQDAQVWFEPFYSDPLMMYAFYTRLSPTEFQNSAVWGSTEAKGFSHTTGLQRRLKVVEGSPLAHLCSYTGSPDNLYYVTQFPFKDAAGNEIGAFFTSRSGDKVLAYGYVYQVTTFLRDIVCK